MTRLQVIAARFSLAFLWLFTGLTSLFFAPEIGYQVLKIGGVTGLFAGFCLVCGGLLDLVIGVWILSAQRKQLCYIVQILVIITFTILLTFIDASFWLHPFGPITKNIPILIQIWILYSETESNECQN